jgi:hypothetical protein
VASELAEGLPPGLALDQAQALLAFASGDREAADAALGRMQESRNPAAAAHVAVAHAFRGEPDATFHALDAALEYYLALPDRSLGRHFAVELGSSPFLRPLHADSRWHAWLQSSDRAIREPGDEQILALLRDYAAQDRDS